MPFALLKNSCEIAKIENGNFRMEFLAMQMAWARRSISSKNWTFENSAIIAFHSILAKMNIAFFALDSLSK